MICALSKFRRLSLVPNNNFSAHAFDHVHVDTWGPYHHPTQDGKRFFLTIVDDCTRFTWTYLMQHKSEAPSIIKSFFTFVQTQFGKPIKQLRSDNAKELQLEEFLKEQGTLHQFSCPYQPEQNAVVERKHQHLLNVARSLLFQSKVPIQFWGECLATATFLINQVPTPSLKDKSPYELLHNKLPDYNSFKVFGCLYHVAIPMHQRNKFSVRSFPAVFMGYPAGYKGYKVYDLSTKRFVISRDVRFSEIQFPFHTNTLDSTPNPFHSLVLPKPIPDHSLDHNPPQETQNLPDQEPQNLPTPNNNPPQDQEPLEPEPRRSTRNRATPSYLNEYELDTVNTHYPLSTHLSYQNLSPSYQHFVLNVNTHYEPQFYHQAVKYPEWRAPMTAELEALESNKTWTIVSPPW